MNDNYAERMRQWREDWIAKIMQHSQQPQIFWQAVANRFTTDRLRMGRDPISPLGQYVLDSIKCFELLAERNERALHWEVVGDLTKAMILYEANVADCFNNLLPYERLRIIYTDWRWYDDALRVCESYLAQTREPGVGSYEYFHYHTLRIMEKLRQQRNT